MNMVKLEIILKATSGYRKMAYKYIPTMKLQSILKLR